MAKVDHKLSEKSQLSGRFLYDDTNNPTGGATVGFPGYNTSQVNGYRNFLVSETHIFAPTVTNEASRGLAVTGAYTWSKLIEFSSYNAANNQNFSDGGSTNGFSNIRPEAWRSNRKISTNDIPHRFVASYIYASLRNFSSTLALL